MEFLFGIRRVAENKPEKAENNFNLYYILFHWFVILNILVSNI